MSATEYRGVVEPGRGLGRNLLADPAIVDRIEAIVGFRLVPGTLNLRLAAPFSWPQQFAAYLPSAELAPDWAARTGQAGYVWAPALIAGSYRGLAFQADEPGYPPTLVELVCEVRLRETLGVGDGDIVAFSLFASQS